MPTCKVCNTYFPNWIEVDGKKRNVSQRRYCLTCSPFQLHNTRQLHLPSAIEVGKKVCPRCTLEKDAADFYRRRNGNDFSVYCKKCTNDETKERQVEFKRKCVEYKGGKCKLCDYSRYFGGLDFHHSDPTKKDFGISSSKLTKFSERIMRELDKCVCVCCRCHREIHAGLHPEYPAPMVK